MYGIIVTLIVIVAVLLILVVLAQNPKGGGLSSQFGGSGTTQLMGVKKTGDLLEKLTWGFAIALLVLSVSTNFIQPEIEQDVLSSPNIDNAQTTQPAIPQGIQPADADNSGLEDLTQESSTDSTGN
ncbi:preprotein translocase subunit SecG [Ekhidna sp.]|jgi:preprotein translocase subunit SecG|uniref:preprotein translocase subunit SecG n=1 Tax=Ekhidna sp. TaxID=2608089 RepID=UPI0032EEE8CE